MLRMRRIPSVWRKAIKTPGLSRDAILKVADLMDVSVPASLKPSPATSRESSVDGAKSCCSGAPSTVLYTSDFENAFDFQCPDVHDDIAGHQCVDAAQEFDAHDFDDAFAYDVHDFIVML